MKFNNIHSLFGPERPLIAASPPKLVKMSPFSSRISNPTDESREEEQVEAFIHPTLADKQWNIQIPVKLQFWDVADGVRVGREETRSSRLSIQSDFEKPFPQSHKIVLMDPVEDIFFHWTLHVTPFSYQSIASQLNWKFPSSAGDPFKETFRRFAYLVQQCGNDVARSPSTHSATCRITCGSTFATLTFQEIVNGYRTIDLLSLDFIQSPWTEVKQDVASFTTDILHEEVKSNLIQVMETISQYQPALLLQCNELYQSVDTYQKPIWVEAKKRLSDMTGNFEERMAETKSFLNQTDSLEIQNDVVHVRTMKITIHDYSDITKEPKITQKELVFTFLFRKSDQGRMSYRITITDPQDLFFHLSSIDITPEVFTKMTRSLNFNQMHSMESNIPTISRAEGTFKKPFDNQDDPEMLSRKRFQDITSQRGVVGIISGDFMTGVISRPERYAAKLTIRAMSKVESLSTGRKIPKPPMSRDSEKHTPPLLKCELKFTEQLLFQAKSELVIECRDTPVSHLQPYIQTRFSQVKHQTHTSQKKLESLVRLANSKNAALYALLDRPNRNAMFEKQPIAPLATQRYGYEGNHVTNYFENEDIPVEKWQSPFGPTVKVIPTKSVVTMKIPVQARRKEREQTTTTFKLAANQREKFAR